MKHSILSLLLIFGTLGASAQKLHLIMVSDLKDKEFGKIGLQNESYMLKIFKTVENKLSYNLQSIYLNKNNFTAATLKKTIDTLKVTPKDIIVFLYTGYGYYPASNKSQFPFLQLNDFQKTPLSLQEVGSSLKLKKVQLCLAMADCRDSTLIYPPQSEIYSTVSARADKRKLILKQLFLSKSGLITVASCSKNQRAFVSYKTYINEASKQLANEETVSVFMKAFNDSFENVLRTDWKDINGVSFEKLLSATAQRMKSDLEYGKFDMTQTLNWKIDTNTIASKFQPISVFSEADLNKKFAKFIITKNKAARKKLADDMVDIFEEQCNLQITKVNQFPPNHLKFNKAISERSIADYLYTDLANYDPKLLKINLDKANSIDESGFPIMQAMITETWDKP